MWALKMAFEAVLSYRRSSQEEPKPFLQANQGIWELIEEKFHPRCKSEAIRKTCTRLLALRSTCAFCNSMSYPGDWRSTCMGRVCGNLISKRPRHRSWKPASYCIMWKNPTFKAQIMWVSLNYGSDKLTTFCPNYGINYSNSLASLLIFMLSMVWNHTNSQLLTTSASTPNDTGHLLPAFALSRRTE